MLILEGPWFWWLVGTVTVCWRPVFHIFFPFLFYFLSRTCTLISIYPSMSPLSVSLWHLLSPPFLFSVSPSLILCCFILFFFLCGLFSYSLVSLSDPCWTCLTGHLSLSFSHSFAPSPSTSLSVCLLQTEQPLRASSFKPFCVAAFQPP